MRWKPDAVVRRESDPLRNSGHDVDADPANLPGRLRHQGADEIIYAPEFRREIEAPIAGAVPSFPHTRLVITEGNYLLLDSSHWAKIPSLLDDVWYIDVNDALRTDRLTQRHQQYGRKREAAMEWVAKTDEPNARLIAMTRPKARLIFRRDDVPTDPALQNPQTD